MAPRDARPDTHDGPGTLLDGLDPPPPDTAPAAPQADDPGGPRTRPKARRRLPADFALTAKLRSYAADKGVQASAVPDMFEHFCNHHSGKGTTMADWDRAWMTWVQNASRFGNNRVGPRSSAHSPNATVSYANTEEAGVTYMTGEEWRRGA